MRGFREFFAFSIAAVLTVSVTLAAYAFRPTIAAQTEAIYASRFSTLRSYKQVVPAFIEAAVETVEGSGVDLADTGEWIDEMEAMLPEFLSDMILVQKAMSEQEWGEYNIVPVQAFSDKWSARVLACPDCEELVPLLKPLVNELFAEFPHPIWRTADVPPLGYLYQPHQRIARWNPWGLGTFYGFEWLEDHQKERMINEVSRERTDSGIRTVYVVERNVIEIRNNEQIFHEQVFNDSLVSAGVLYDPVSMLHEMLEQLIADNEDPKLIRVLTRIVEVADDKIAEAKESGLMDEDAYNYLYNPMAVLNRIIQNKHPLMDAPYNTQYKVAEFYPLPPAQEE